VTTVSGQNSPNRFRANVARRVRAAQMRSPQRWRRLSISLETVHRICGKNIHHTPHACGDRAPFGGVSNHGGLEAPCKSELSVCTQIIRIWMRMSRLVSGLCALCHCLGRTGGQRAREGIAWYAYPLLINDTSNGNCLPSSSNLAALRSHVSSPKGANTPQDLHFCSYRVQPCLPLEGNELAR